MSITIDNAEVEALLADLTATTRRAAPDLLLELLPRARVAEDRERDRADAIAAGRLLRERWKASAEVDPRTIEEILSYDEYGVPVCRLRVANHNHRSAVPATIAWVVDGPWAGKRHPVPRSRPARS